MQNRVAPALRSVLESSMAPAVKTKVLDALLWLHLPGQIAITPHTLFTVVHTTSSAAAPAIVGYSPWPASDVTAVRFPYQNARFSLCL